MDAGYLRPLRDDDYLVVNYGPTTGSVPYRVRRARVFDFVYDPVKQAALAGPMVQAGSNPGAGQAANFVDNVLFGLSATVTSINGVFDVFLPQMDGEMLQMWFGVAPRQVRVWPKQPYNQFSQVLDQNIIPAATYTDVGFVDGFDSPFGRPSRETELLSIRNLSVNWTLANPGPWPVNPRFFFVVNRMFVDPVCEATLAVALLRHQVPARSYSIGNPTQDVTYAAKGYGDIKPIKRDALSAGGPTLQEALKEGGYR